VVFALALVVSAAEGRAARAQERGAAQEEADRAEDLKKALRKLNGRSAQERASGAAALGAMGKAARSAIPQLVSRLSDGDNGVRCAAAEALGRIDDGSPKVVSALGAAVAGKPAVRASAASALAEIGEKAQPALAALVKALPETTDPQARAQVVRALGRIGAPDPKQRKVLVDLVRAELSRSAEPDVRFAAAGALVRLGESDAAAVPVLAEVAARPRRDLRARREAIEGLARLGAAAAPAVPRLAEVVREGFVPDPALPYQDEERRLHGEVRAEAARVLGALGAAAKAALPALDGVGASDDEVVRAAAREAAERIRAS
jgi:HEAT repeat protein